MKKSFFVLFGFLIGMLILTGPMASFAQTRPPDQQGSPGRDLNQQQPGSAPQADDPMDQGGGTQGSPMLPTKGKVSGEVLNVDPPTGLIEIRTDEGLINIFTVEGDAKQQLDQVKKGDQVDLIVTLNAVEVNPQGPTDGSTEPPAG